MKCRICFFFIYIYIYIFVSCPIASLHSIVLQEHLDFEEALYHVFLWLPLLFYVIGHCQLVFPELSLQKSSSLTGFNGWSCHMYVLVGGLKHELSFCSIQLWIP